MECDRLNVVTAGLSVLAATRLQASCAGAVALAGAAVLPQHLLLLLLLLLLLYRCLQLKLALYHVRKRPQLWRQQQRQQQGRWR
jgi:hypothetical protein